MPTNAVPIVVASGALAVSILSLLWQRHIGRHATSFPLVVDLFREYRSRDMVAARRYVRTELAGQHDPQLGLSGLPDEVRPDVLWVCHFFDNVGLLIAHDLADWQLVAGFVGDGALGVWQVLEPYVHHEAVLRSGPYQPYFQDLVRRLKAAPPRDTWMKVVGKRTSIEGL